MIRCAITTAIIKYLPADISDFILNIAQFVLLPSTALQTHDMQRFYRNVIL